MRLSQLAVPAVFAALLLLGGGAPARAQGIYSCEVNGKRVQKFAKAMH